MLDKTMTFSLGEDKEQEMKQILTTVYDALREKGYNPINQIVGYILSEDPTYITTHNSARSLIRKLDRDELLRALVRSYLNEGAPLVFNKNRVRVHRVAEPVFYPHGRNASLQSSFPQRRRRRQARIGGLFIRFAGEPLSHGITPMTGGYLADGNPLP